MEEEGPGGEGSGAGGRPGGQKEPERQTLNPRYQEEGPGEGPRATFTGSPAAGPQGPMGTSDSLCGHSTGCTEGWAFNRPQPWPLGSQGSTSGPPRLREGMEHSRGEGDGGGLEVPGSGSTTKAG